MKQDITKTVTLSDGRVFKLRKNGKYIIQIGNELRRFSLIKKLNIDISIKRQLASPHGSKIMKKIKDKIRILKQWIRFLLSDRTDLVKFNIVKIRGKQYIYDGNNLQCPYCLYLQDLNKTVENSLKDPNGLLKGFYFKLENECHYDNCIQK